MRIDRAFSRFIILFTWTISIILNLYPAFATYPDGPSDLAALKSELSKSLVVTNWNSNKGIGFAGSYNLSQDQKDAGINSILVTTLTAVSEDFDLLKSCFARGRTKDVSLDYNGKRYQGTCSAFNSGGTDLATIQSSLNLPSISLYDSYIPSVGQWVIAAYYVEGFGIQFAVSKVKFVNNADYILAIDKFEPKPVTGALMFNSLGNFVGVLTEKGIGSVPAEYFKVQGAPLQCQIKGQTGGTITLCPNTQDKIWTNNNPGQVSQPEVLDAGKEATDAFKAVEDSYNAYQESLSQCIDTYNSVSVAVNKYLKMLKFDLICKNDESQAKTVFSKAKTISTSKQFSNNEIDQLNSYTDSMNSYAEAADIANAQIQDAITYLNYAIDSKEEVKRVNLFATNTWKQLNLRIAKLSKAMKSKIVISPEYIEITKSLTQWSEFSDLINEFLNSISPTSNLRYLENANSELKSMEPQVTSSSLEYDAAAISGLLPKYVCTKGKDVVAIIGKNCKTGYKKITV